MKTYLIPIIAAASLLVGCNRSIESASEKFNALPQEVQKTVRAQAPNAEIANISDRTQDGVRVYEIEFRENGRNPKMVVAADGRVLSSELTSKPAGAIEKLLTPTGAVGTKLSSLPEAAQKTIQARAPNAEIADISRHEDNGRVYYEVSFKDTGKNPSIKVADDGTLIQDLQK
jgi:uncharacterized membrane protein YkoI